MPNRPSRIAVAATVSFLSGLAAAQPAQVLAAAAGEAASDRAVSIDLAALAQDHVSFRLPSGGQVTGEVTLRVTHPSGASSWRGTIESVEHGQFSIAASDGVAHGVIWAGELGTYEIRARADGLYDTVRTDTIDFPPCAGPLRPDAAARGIPGLRERAIAEQRHDDANGTTAPAARGGDDGSVVDILIVYTAEARIGAGGTAAIEALAQNAVNATNTAYANSNIGPLELRLVRTEEISYTESGDAVADLVALRRTDDGIMDEVHQIRDQVGADLVALLVDDFNACGIAYLAPFNQDFGFSVTDTGCAVGNLTFAHEVGHNMGSTHDRGNGSNSNFPYGFGWRWDGLSGTQFRSVMAYSPGSRVPHFSNPGIAFDGVATGTNDDDNARVHDETRASVANFRQSVVAPGCVADTNADGLLSPADFNAWILAFNAQSAACDQNGDGQCAPADFNAWILNYNAGC